MQKDLHQDLHILQLTDLHLFGEANGHMLGMNTRDSFLDVLALSLQRFKHTDFILCTGDLVHDESAAGYQFLADSLKATGIPFACIPGNHDDINLMSNLCAPTQKEARIELGNWQILLLNSQKQGCVEGRIDEQELAFLRTQLEQHSNLFSMICLHHPLVDLGSRWIDSLRCENGEQVLQQIEQHRQAKLVCWGHAHQDYEQRRRQLQLFGTPSTCFQFKPGSQDFAIDLIPPGYRWFQLCEDGTFTSDVARLAALPAGLNVSVRGY